MFADFPFHQMRILDALATGDQLLVRAVPDVAALAKVRWTLVGTIREYQIYKHSRIFDPLITRGSGNVVPIAIGMKAMCTANGAAGRQFILDWSGKSVGDHWPAYSRAALAMNENIRQSLTAERLGMAELEAAVVAAGGWASATRRARAV